MDQIDDRTFRVDFTADGVALLKQRVDDKLKEFMGDYTDDTLVEYVIVLLRNGRRKEEAKSELDVFLGDDSDSFVLWLWDHLAANIDQYVESCNPIQDEASKPKSVSPEPAGTNISRHPDYDKEQAEVDKTSRSRHSRKWRGLATNESQPPTLRSCVVDEAENVRKIGRNHGSEKRSVSPDPQAQRKRSRATEREHENKHENEHERPKRTVGASRRLLQFAVRDAVGTTRPSVSVTEPGAKRLRSVVSTPTGESLQTARSHRPQSVAQSVARAPNTMAAAIKAVAEAAEDVVKARPKRNVFDRLNRAVAPPVSTKDLLISRDHGARVDEYEESYPHQEQIDYQSQMDSRQVDYYHTVEKTHKMHVEQGDYSGKYVGNATMLHSDTGMASDSASDNEPYGDINVMGRRRVDVSKTGSSSGRKREGSLMVQYSVAQNTDEVSPKTRPKEQDPPLTAASASRKILNISVNVNTWKPPHYQPQSDATEMDTQRSLQQNEVGAGKSSVHFIKEHNNSLARNGNGKAVLQTLNEPQKSLASGPGSYTTGRPLEDADSRTIFVNNVHFAATKDSLSRHFNKFGDVLKVVILSDAATGQPKGSAHVEFMRKEAAENALSLDGTSFMSRILKVVKKSSVQQEVSPAMAWPRASQSSPFAVARFSRGSFPRGFAGAYRGRPPVKSGARSMQWKRDAPVTMLENVSSVTGNNSIAPPSVGRGLTYVRAETKPTGNPDAV